MRDFLSALNEYPGESIAARQTTPIDRLQWNGACWFPHDYSQVACTSGTASGEILSHKFSLTRWLRRDNAGEKTSWLGRCGVPIAGSRFQDAPIAVELTQLRTF